MLAPAPQERIPTATRIDGTPHVYVQENGKWVPRKVEIGLDNNRMIHLISGVKKGEVIMMAPPVKETKSAEKSKPSERKPGPPHGKPPLKSRDPAPAGPKS